MSLVARLAAANEEMARYMRLMARRQQIAPSPEMTRVLTALEGKK